MPENPRDLQKLLALDIVTQYHGKESALQAQSAALSIISGSKTRSDSVPEFSLAAIQFPTKLANILSGSSLCKSNGDARVSKIYSRNFFRSNVGNCRRTVKEKNERAAQVGLS
jgi:tyrosyl-tRNA synthetase